MGTGGSGQAAGDRQPQEGPLLERIVSLPSSPHILVSGGLALPTVEKPTTSGDPHSPSRDGEEVSRCLDTPQSHPYCFPDSELVWKESG